MGPGGHCEVFKAFLHLFPNREEGIDSWDLEVRPLLYPYLDTTYQHLWVPVLSAPKESQSLAWPSSEC